jgi:hypothetical protein
VDLHNHIKRVEAITIQRRISIALEIALGLRDHFFISIFSHPAMPCQPTTITPLLLADFQAAKICHSSQKVPFF